MEKKIYSRPYAAEECFTPNQYVASCAVEPDIPTGYSTDHFYIDGLHHGNNTHHSSDAEGKCSGDEHVNGLKTLDNKAMQGRGLAKFIENYPNYHIDQGYYDLTGGNQGIGQWYTNTRYFEPFLILHPANGSSQFYFLGAGTKTSDNAWDYVTPSMKNQS